MKLIHQFRATNSFCIVATDVENMASIQAHFERAGGRVCAFAHDAVADGGEQVYTVRVTQDERLRDLRVRVIGNRIEVLDTYLICDLREPVAN